MKNFALKVLTDEQEIFALREQWECLFAASSAPALCYFQSPEWCLTWLEMSSRPGGRIGSAKPYVITVWNEQELVFILPMIKKRQLKVFNKLSPMTGALAQYSKCILRKDYTTNLKARRELVAFLKTEMIGRIRKDGVLGIDLEAVPEGSILAEVFCSQLVESVAGEGSIIDLSALPEEKDYASTLSKNMRKNLGRRERKLQEMGALAFSFHKGTDVDVADLLKTMAEWKKAWFDKKGIISLTADNSNFIDYLQQISRSECTVTRKIVSVVTLDGKPVAAEIGFEAGGHYLAYYSAFHPDYATSSPGSLLLVKLVDWLRQNEVKVYDFLPQPAAYKDDFANKTLSVSHLKCNLAKGIARFPAGIILNGRAHAKKLLNSMPAPMRRASAFALQKSAIITKS